MENVSNGQHRGPVAPIPRGRSEEDSGKKGRRYAPKGDAALERKRAKAREYYYAHKERLKRQKKESYALSKGKALRIVQEDDPKPAVPKRPGKVDALICINRSLLFLNQGDIDGAELWSRFAARIIEGKE